MLDIKKKINKYIIFTLITLLFSIIYELFSFNVLSLYMLLAFLIPLFGLIIYLVMYKINKVNYNSLRILDLSLVTLTLGSIIKGILDIYGTTNYLIYIHLILGIILFIISIIILLKKVNS
ncbi:MAG: hypothetical protein IJ572_03860 [Bacilli bacterium]|nr:hypothetical protein [Bacilli bacterium]